MRCSLFKFLVVFAPFWLMFLVVVHISTRQLVIEQKLKPRRASYNVIDKMYAEMGFRKNENAFFGVRNVSNLFPLKHMKEMKIQSERKSHKTEVFLKKRGKVLVKQGKGRKKISSIPNIFNDPALGEFGKAVNMPKSLPPDIQDIVDDGWKKNAFNQYLSDLISVRRKLPDCQGNYCKVVSDGYSKTLPATSVIFIYHNEAWSTLLRSVHSVLDRSPKHLIAEVILVDDASTLGEAKRRKLRR